ncbi:dihydrodipicolinate reductase, partial [Yinghuangia sp. KLBMP8922]|nr:dihydrodipicolinate reductase [Yinghuangia soli]
TPRIEVTVEATDEGENRSAGGNATAVGRLVNAIDWLTENPPGLYDALDVPLRAAVGKLGKGRNG